jgi:hypothetical protein
MIKAILVKPLDGQPAGSEREFSQADFDHLTRLGAVREAGAKSAPEVLNKAAPVPDNKATTRRAKAG